jgi:ligand-binding sensor domain-containing protein
MQKVIHMKTYGVGSRFCLIAITLLLLLVFLTSCAPTAGIFAGGKWQAGGLQHQQLLSLAVDPNNPQIIYAGDMKDGVFTSTNAGMNWSQKSAGLALPISIFALAIDDSGKKLYAATDTGIFVSADAATHWIQLSGLPVDSYSSVTFDLNAPHVIYVASEHHGVYTSTNDGSSWTIINNGLPSGIIINNLAFDSVEHHLWAATSLGIYRSDNGGALWQVLNNGLPSNIDVNTVLPAASSGGNKGLVFAGTNHGLYLSNNDGAQWAQSQVSLTGTSVNAILIDYHTVTTVYAGTGIGVLRSDDNGQNWGGIASGLPSNPAIQALAIGANGYNQLYAATNGIYLFPGNSSVFDPSQIIPLLLILAFFFALYRFSTRGRRRSQSMFKAERVVETKQPLPRDDSQTYMADETQPDGRLSEVNEHERKTENDHEDDKKDEI